MPSGQQKEINVLKQLVRQRGYKVAPSGSGHWKVLDAKGRAVLDADGPLILSGTSSEGRSRTMSVKRLMAAGVLLEDPWAPTKAKDASTDSGEQVSDAETARLEREAEQRRTADQRHGERTLAIRERLEPIILNLGGWDKRGMLKEVGLVAHYFATQSELLHAWAAPDAAAENADSLRKGATLSPAMAPLWEGLLGELEAYPDTRLRWMQLVREAKQLDPPTIGSPETAPTSISVVQPEAAPSGSALPLLALRAAFEMGVGRGADDPYRREVAELIVNIARLELQALAPPPHEGDG